MKAVQGIVGGVFAVFAVPVSAQEQDLTNLTSMVTMEGKCHKLVIGGADASALCKGAVVNFAYRSGRSSFQFVAEDRAVVGFYGTDSAADGDEAMLKVEKITLNLMMGLPSTAADASGTCTYTNPYAGPSLIQCTATSGGKAFAATFVSDGSEPSVEEF